MPAMITYQGIYKSYSGHAALTDFNLEVQRGETLALIGPSGGGKTTALKLANGLLRPSQGTVLLGGRPVDQWDLQERRRAIGYVIQQVGLFPHWTVERNVGVLPTLEGWPPEKIAARVDELLSLVDLQPDRFKSRYPSQLSGGQAQRVGVARALALSPTLLLMDEPFGALDPLIRAQLQTELLAILKTAAITTIFVTHDLHEAFRMGTRVAVLAEGKLEQVGSPAELLSDPRSPYLKRLIEANLLQVRP
ncbi:MAG: ABC transporter ATP-binding protein [Candidatus Marinimicrobia bacterium]|nr:ABC transporter ATP-binding protein [Candidatus Neomarinimicrobiota bacterium]